MTSPPAILPRPRDRGALAPEGVPRGPAGDVRAFDATLGRERWRFHTVPRPGEFGHDTWPADGWQRRTGANVWSSMSVDQPSAGWSSSPSARRRTTSMAAIVHGANLFGTSLVALDAATGRRRWHAQLVHHDLWDFDPPAQPILADIQPRRPHDPRCRPGDEDGTGVRVRSNDRRTRLRDRRTTGSIERCAGRGASPTQPFPRKPKPLSRHRACDARRLDGCHAGVAPRVRGALRAGQEWRPLHPGRARPDALVSRDHGRRDVVGRSLRPQQRRRSSSTRTRLARWAA